LILETFMRRCLVFSSYEEYFVLVKMRPESAVVSIFCPVTTNNTDYAPKN
jgi:hypothetical protein